jgi:DNA-binding PadR family transcriptional regulator
MVRTANASRQTRELLQEMLGTPRQWRHGYELSQATKLRSGTLYPLLIRLESQGLLEAKWEEPERPGRPPRHAYRLTTEGLVLARDMAPAKAAFRQKLRGATA